MHEKIYLSSLQIVCIPVIFLTVMRYILKLVNCDFISCYRYIYVDWFSFSHLWRLDHMCSCSRQDVVKTAQVPTQSRLRKSAETRSGTAYLAGPRRTITARVCSGMNLHIWCVVVTNLSVCLFVCQQVACDVVTVYSRSESPCHVSLSLSQSNQYRSFARPVDRSVTIPRSVSRSVYLCLSVPVQRTTPAHTLLLPS